VATENHTRNEGNAYGGAGGPSNSANKNQGQVSLLVIEDDAVLLDSVREILQFEGYEVHVASNGTEGLMLARELLPDGILLDIKLPDMDGYAVLKALKQQEATQPIPTIVISAYTRARRRSTALDLGAVAYITKPFATQELLSEIRRWILGRTSSKDEHE
jgi:DNA-binding response OmpR family regulator